MVYQAGEYSNLNIEVPTKVLHDSCTAHCSLTIFELWVGDLYSFHTIICFFNFSLEVEIKMHYCKDMPEKKNSDL